MSDNHEELRRDYRAYIGQPDDIRDRHSPEKTRQAMVRLCDAVPSLLDENEALRQRVEALCNAASAVMFGDPPGCDGTCNYAACGCAAPRVEVAWNLDPRVVRAALAADSPEPERPTKPCADCGHDVSVHHKLRCEAPEVNCYGCNGWTCPEHGLKLCGCTYLGGPVPSVAPETEEKP